MFLKEFLFPTFKKAKLHSVSYAADRFDCIKSDKAAGNVKLTICLHPVSRLRKRKGLPRPPPLQPSSPLGSYTQRQIHAYLSAFSSMS
jgi:hypothetical protein